MKVLLILYPILTCTRPIDLANSAKKLDTIKKFFTNMLENSETIMPIGIIDAEKDFPYDNNTLVQLYYLQLNTLKGMGQVTDGKEYIYTFMDLYNKFVHWDMMDKVFSNILRYIVNTNKMLCEVMPINTSIDIKGEYNPNYLLLENIPMLIDAKNSYISKIKSYIDSNLFTKGLLEKKIDIEAKINYGLLLLINDMNKASLAYLKILQKIGQDLIALDLQIKYDELKESYDKTLRVYLHGCTTPTSIYSNIKMSIESISTYENEKITPKSNLFEMFPKLQGRQIFYEAHMSYLYSKLYLFTKYLEFTTAHYKTIITEKKLNNYLKRCFTKIKTECEKHLQTCNGLNYNYFVDIDEFVMDEIVKAELQMMVKDIWKLLVNCQESTKNLIDLVVNKKTKTQMRGAILR